MAEMEQTNYTDMLLSVRDTLGKEFEQLWLRDEFLLLINSIEEMVDNLCKKYVFQNTHFQESLREISEFVNKMIPNKTNLVPSSVDNETQYKGLLALLRELSEKLDVGYELDQLINNLKEDHDSQWEKILQDAQIKEILGKIDRYRFKALPDENVVVPEILINETEYHDLLSSLKEASLMLKTQEEVDGTFFDLLSEKYNEYKGSEDYIRRLVVRRLQKISPEFVCQTDSKGELIRDEEGSCVLVDDIFKKNKDGSFTKSTRLLILKQFIKQFGWCRGVKHDKDARGEGYECENLRIKIQNQVNTPSKDEKDEKHYAEFAKTFDESIFSEFDFNARGRKSDCNFRMLKVADSLAKGFFGSKNPTREDLYVFAIAFEMTFSPTVPDKEKNPDEYETDIRKNLFFDYYTNNLLNHVETIITSSSSNKTEETSSDLNEPNKTSSSKSDASREKYVSGYGINYKNFLEIIYLYYISKTDLTALEKFISARKMIIDCSKSEKALSEEDVAGSLKKRSISRETVQYRDWFGEYKYKSEEEFKAFILKTYACKTIGTAESVIDLDKVDHSEKLQKQLTNIFNRVAKKTAVTQLISPEDKDAFLESEIAEMKRTFDRVQTKWSVLKTIEEETKSFKNSERRDTARDQFDNFLAQINERYSIEDLDGNLDEDFDEGYMYFSLDRNDPFHCKCMLIETFSVRVTHTSIYSENKTANKYLKGLVKSFYHLERKQDANPRIVCDYKSKIKGFVFLTEYGKQISSKDIYLRGKNNQDLQVRDADGHPIKIEELKKAIADRTAVADKNGVMLPRDEFQRRYKRLTENAKWHEDGTLKVADKNWFKDDGKPLLKEEYIKRKGKDKTEADTDKQVKKKKAEDVASKKEYEAIYVFNKQRKAAPVEELLHMKIVVDRIYQIKNKDNDWHTVNMDDITSLFVYNKYGKPLIGYNTDFLLACWSFDDILKADTAIRNFCIEKNKQLEFGMKKSSDMRTYIASRADIMIAACHFFINKKEYDRIQPKAIFSSFNTFFTYIQSEWKIMYGQKIFHGINDLLIDCGFMEVNQKSLFDIMLLYFTYNTVWAMYRKEYENRKVDKS